MKKAKLILSLMSVSILFTIGVMAQTINAVSVTYSRLQSTKTITSDTIEAKYGEQKFFHKATRIISDVDFNKDTYLRVKAQRKGLFGIYSTKHTVDFLEPVLSVTASTQYIELEKGDYRYQLYNYGIIEMDGVLTVNITDN